MTESPTGQMIVLDFDRVGILLGVEVLGARSILNTEFIDGAERLDQQAVPCAGDSFRLWSLPGSNR
ncbi:hypothetical protein [Microbacterium elymi]|uniref:DUF2283 domain-containing protein n=1 Tax=Microbacterium elymi TaxID=2909587 RepID=A0ABY5NGL2_9MICO|nr:hypothetical protein [Microbacterium elymi]UUT34342.1 hypothetical protein L2X98_27260 [Microbacterium elymi]